MRMRRSNRGQWLVAVGCVAAPLGAPPSIAVAQQGSDSKGATEPSSDDAGSTLDPKLRKRTQQKWDPNTYELRLDPEGFDVSTSKSPARSIDRKLREYRTGIIVSSAPGASGRPIFHQYRAKSPKSEGIPRPGSARASGPLQAVPLLFPESACREKGDGAARGF